MKADFRIATLASGSSGNSVYAECADGAVLIDAGTTQKAIKNGIAAIGGDISKVEAIVVTHCHTDHSKTAERLASRYNMTVYMTEGTIDGCGCLDDSDEITIFDPGDTLSVGGFDVHTIATPHDTDDSCAVVVERRGTLCGVLTDLGRVTDEIIDIFAQLHGAILESNYDPQMLEDGPYYEDLKDRIRGGNGHISNVEAAELVRDHAGAHLRNIVLAHLSINNNTPETALDCMMEIAGERIRECGISLSAAPRKTPGALIRL